MKTDKPPKDGRTDDQEPEATRDDVAGLYSWAKMEGSKYRDFSASRNQSRSEAQDRNYLEKNRREQAAANLPLADEDHDETDFLPAETGSQRVTPPSRFNGERSPDRLGLPGPRRVPPPATRDPRRTPPAVTARWSALKRLFDPPEEPLNESKLPPVDLGIPSLAFVSLTGGVGKTSLVAALGSALARRGESVLLVDTQSFALLPFYFAVRERASETTRPFPGNSTPAPLRVLTLDRQQDDKHSLDHPGLVERIVNHASGMHRVLIDVSTGSTEIMQQVLRLSPRVLVTLTPDMASVVSLQPVREFFEELSAPADRPIELFYLLNQFDPSLRLHMDVRALLTRQLGERLLPVVVHRSGAFSEAVAEGMTLVDYAPQAQVAGDVNSLAQWLQELDKQAGSGPADLRWRERRC